MGRMRGTGNELKKRGSTWYTYYYASDGRLIDKALGTRSKTEADARLAAHKAATEAEIAATGVSGGTQRASKSKKPAVDLLDEMEAWDLDRARTKSNRGRGLHKGTIAQVEYCWRQIRKHIKRKEQITRQGLVAFVKARQGDVSRRTGGLPPSNKTIRQDVWALKRALEEMEARGRRVPLMRQRDWPSSLLEHYKSDRCHKTRSHAIQRSDVLAQLQGFAGGRSAEEHRALFILHLLTGMRKDEVAMVVERPTMVRASDAHGGMVVVNTEQIVVRNEFARTIPLTPDALAAMRLLQSLPRIKEHRSAFQRAAKRAGLPRSAHLRDLRATFITACNDLSPRAGVGRYLAGHAASASDSHACYDGKNAAPAITAVRAVARKFGFAPGDPVVCPEDGQEY